MNLLFTICGRAGSKGFQNKNLKEMNGVSLVYYTLAAIKLYTERHDDVVKVALNTDSGALTSIVKKQKAVTAAFVPRRKELAGDTVAKVDVIKDTYLEMSYGSDTVCDAVIDLDITSPLRTVGEMENLLREYNSNADYDLVTSVVLARRSPYFNMVEKRGDFYRKICESKYTTRQETPVSYELNASIYVYRPAFLESEIKNTILDSRCGVSVVKDRLVLDIDSEEDFRMMEMLHGYYCEHDADLNEIFMEAKRLAE